MKKIKSRQAVYKIKDGRQIVNLIKKYHPKLLEEILPSQRKVIKNITEENLRWMIKHGKVDERIYE